MAWDDKYVDLALGSGGTGTTGDPWGSFADALTGLGTIAGPTRVYVRGDATLAGALDLNPAGTSAANPLWWVGCTGSGTTWMPADTADGAATKPTITCGTNQVTISAGWQFFQAIAFASTCTASGGAVNATGGNLRLLRLRVENTAANANARALTVQTSGGNHVVGCSLRATTTAWNAVQVTASTAVVGCAIRGGGGGGGGTAGLSLGGVRCLAAHSTVIGSAGDGIVFGGNAEIYVVGNTVADCDGHGIAVGSEPTFGLLANNLLAGNGAGGTGYGIAYTGAGSINAMLLLANAFHGNATGQVLGFVEQSAATDALMAGFRNLAESSDPLTDAAGFDLSLASWALSKGAGFPGEFENESYTSARDIGAVQSASAAATTSTDPGEANVRAGTAYTIEDVAKTGTLTVPSLANTKVGVAGDGGTGTYDGSDRWTDPGVANVRASTAYKANSTTNNRTGTCAVPAAGDVQSGVSVDATTGTFVVPAESQVEDGFGFGAAGTEFTGTLTAGGITLTDLQTELAARIPPLVGGRMDSYIGAVADGLTNTDPIEANVTQIGGQAVTCVAPVTVLPSVGTATTSTAQTGDAYARLGAPAGASHAADVAAVKADTAAVKLKTDNLPAEPAGVSDLPDVSGLATASALATVASDVTAIAGDVDTEVAAILSAVQPAALRTALGLAAADLDTQLDAIKASADAAGGGPDPAYSGTIATASNGGTGGVGIGTFNATLPAVSLADHVLTVGGRSYEIATHTAGQAAFTLREAWKAVPTSGDALDAEYYPSLATARAATAAAVVEAWAADVPPEENLTDVALPTNRQIMAAVRAMAVGREDSDEEAGTYVRQHKSGVTMRSFTLTKNTSTGKIKGRT